MPHAQFRHLLAGLDTVQVAYYLRCIGYGAEFSFEKLLLERERLRAANTRTGCVVEIGDRTFQLQRYGSSSGYPLVLKNAEVTIECGENNSPGFFVTYRSEALWRRGAQALHEAFIAWAESVGLVVVRDESLSRVDYAFDYSLPAVDFTEDSVVSLSLGTKDAQYRDFNFKSSARKTHFFGPGVNTTRVGGLPG